MEDGPKEIYFLDSTENKEVYKDILYTCLPHIKRLQSGELIF
jgi:hypothetical protein